MRVITAPNWLFNIINNLSNEKGTALLIPAFDKNDRPILGMSVLKDPDWAGIGLVTDPEGNKVKITEVIEFIEYEPKEDVLDL